MVHYAISLAPVANPVLVFENVFACRGRVPAMGTWERGISIQHS